MINEKDPSPHSIPLQKLAVEKIKKFKELDRRDKQLLKNPKYNSIASGIGIEENILEGNLVSSDEEKKGSTGDAPVTSRFSYKSIIKLII